MPVRTEVLMGTFVTVDVVAADAAPEAIDRAAEALGYSRREYILKSYLALYLDECRSKGESPRDMLFTRKA